MQQHRKHNMAACMLVRLSSVRRPGLRSVELPMRVITSLLPLMLLLTLTHAGYTGHPTHQQEFGLRLHPQPLLPAAPAFPPGRRFQPSLFWAASVATQNQRPLPGDRNGPLRKSADFISSGEAAMLAWSPPSGAEYVQPLASSQTLVRFLGGLSSTSFPKGTDVTDGDVVYMAPNGTLQMRWSLVFERLDPFVSNHIHPVIVLDNVPWAFVKGRTGSAKYGQNMGPDSVTEYYSFITELLHGLVERYTLPKVETFWFRVGTEPNTQPNHWNDTVTKFVDMYIAVAKAIAEIAPGAKLGPANFAADGDARQQNWDDIVVPMVSRIVAAKAKVDYIAMSSYGRASRCSPMDPISSAEDTEVEEWDRRAAAEGVARIETGGRHLAGEQDSKFCEYSWQFSDLTASRLLSLQAMLPNASNIPMQVMEYGDQANKRRIIDSQPGSWGGAWTLMSSVQFALRGIERAYHWGYGDRNFGNGKTVCPEPLSKCGLYGGNMWVAAAAGHLFGNGTATVLANVSASRGTRKDGGVVASGIGGWGNRMELLLLVSVFSADKDEHTPAQVTVTFDRPAQWGSVGSELPPMQTRSMVLNTNSSVYDTIHREASASHTLAVPDDPNVYQLGKMLTTDGLSAVKSESERWLAMQRAMYTPSSWTPVETNNNHIGSDGGWMLSCEDGKLCSATLIAPPPTVSAVWFALSN